ncbi:MAG TPA: O-antigen ligase family protein [Polyangia bacterium]|nr:O-antigen ligase family protein [Polyangia bacterium]
MNLLLGALGLNLLYVVNEIHFNLDTHIPGLSPTNIIFLVMLLFMRGKEEVVKTEPYLKKAIFIFYGGLTFGFLWAQIRAPGPFLDDITYYKNALFYPLYYFVFLKCRQDEKNTRRLIIWILVIAAVAALEAVREGLDYGFGKYNAFRRASGPFGTDWHMSNRAGVYYGMFMGMFVALAIFLKGKGKRLWRIAAIGGASLTAVGALATYSRQSYFLVLLAIVVLLVRRSLILAGFMVVVAISLVGYLPDSVFQRVEETKQQGKSGDEEVDASTSSRWEIWEGGMHMLAANPIGVGLHRWTDEIGNYSSFKHIDAHNFYVLTLGECGPLGEVTLIYLIVSLFGLARFIRKNRPPDDPEATALALGFTVTTLNMALGGIYGSPTLQGSVMGTYWALGGLLERYMILKKQNAGPSGSGEVVEEKRGDSLTDRFPLAAYITPGSRKTP